MGANVSHGAGRTISEAARELKVPYRTFLRAVKEQQVRVIVFGGARRVTAAEMARLKKEYRGISSDGAA